MLFFRLHKKPLCIRRCRAEKEGTRKRLALSTQSHGADNAQRIHFHGALAVQILGTTSKLFAWGSVLIAVGIDRQ